MAVAAGAGTVADADDIGIEAAAAALGLATLLVEVASPSAAEARLEAAVQEGINGLFAFPATLGFAAEMATFAARHGLPASYPQREFVEAGGLMSYGASFTDLIRRSAGYVDRILKGARPADMPIDQAMRFELVWNRLAGEALGLAVPRSFELQGVEVL